MRKLVLSLLIALSPLAAYAHGGEDHSHDAPAAPVLPNAGQPSRLADGTVFLPKPSQRLYGIRTQLVERRALRPSVELQGQVVADPNAAGQVQATQAGRVKPGPEGLPVLGQRVRAGQVLAFVEPLASSLERAGAQAQVAEIDGQLEVARQRLARLEQLEGSVPRRELEEAQSAVQSLERRRRALGAGLGEDEPLRAPVTGVVSSSALVSGRVVEAREKLAEIVDPTRLLVEARAFDPALVNGLAEASALAGSQPLKLAFLGAGYRLQEHAIPLQFRLLPPVPELAIGQPLTVLVQSGEPVEALAVPRTALQRHPAGGALVWVHATAETFVPRQVQTQPLDGDRVRVTQGLRGGERVVVEGASLLGQVR